MSYKHFRSILSFNFLCWAIQKLHFGRAILGRAFLGSHFGEIAPKKILKFGPNNFLTNVFIHYECQLFMFSSLKVSFWGFTPQGSSNLVQTIVSQTTSYIVLSIFFKNFTLGRPFFRVLLHKGLPNLVQTIVSQTTSYIVTFNCLYSVVQKFRHGRVIFWRGGASFPKDLQI